MRRIWAVAGLWLAVVGAGAPGDIYPWAYDQLALGPGWTGHVFANRTEMEVQGLELLVGQTAPAQVLVVGGTLFPMHSLPEMVLTGRVVPGGVVVVALPAGLLPLQAAWLTPTGRIPIDLDLPLPRLTVEQILLHVIYVYVEADVPHILPYPEPVFFEWVAEYVRPDDLDRDVLRLWEGYRCFVLLDARRSFSPVGEKIVAWRWFWEDGLVQEGSVIVRGFDRPGLYRVRLVVTDAAGREQGLNRLVEARVWENFSDEPVLSIKPLPSVEQDKPALGKDPFADLKLAR